MMPRPPTDPNVLVGPDTLDDAGVYRIASDLALIQTVDFFTPIVDDGYDFGQIAAANALSDVYAMGGTPKTALNLVCWPPEVVSVVKTTVYLIDLADFEAFNAVYAEVVEEPLPARSTVQVSRLPKDALVEIDAIAHVSR